MENEIKEPKKRGRPRKVKAIDESGLHESYSMDVQESPVDHYKPYPNSKDDLHEAERINHYFEKTMEFITAKTIEIISAFTHQIDRLKMSMHDIYDLLETQAKRDIDTFVSKNPVNPSWNPAPQEPIVEAAPVVEVAPQAPSVEQFMQVMMKAFSTMQQSPVQPQQHSQINNPTPKVMTCHGCRGVKVVQTSPTTWQCKNPQCNLVFNPYANKGR